ncbi:MAG: DNA primase [Nitrosomonas europaea]|uniref:DNA primase n=1 Tax=Nitrosomonas TaxID=914 RepID=UPI0023F4F041|nr:MULTISPECIES: DNA primase [Nitrosomonas]MBV6389078.1 DNA primase [Nitrosomonas europaea]MEB2331889.1 DNA primase [Nitrosomonas sp.]
MIEQSFIQELLDRIDIVDVVARHLQLKKAGANFTACCPFHNEKTPSFTVNSSKQFYHCFGCGRHGNAISFLMEHSGASFVEAVESLATHAGMQIPDQVSIYPKIPDPGRVPSDKVKIDKEVEATSPLVGLYERMEQAAKFYRGQLKQSDQAIAYLKERGISGRTALRFGIGYAPPGWQNLSGIFTDYPADDSSHPLVQAGLVVAHDGKKNYDRFRHRIMFPILDRKKKIVGFGGRALDGGEPKYLNSPETSLFVKGRELYNLASASPAIRKSARVIVVEGYMDVVMLVQSGVENVVATLGTATTAMHIQNILRHTDEVVFCFDGDAAGTKAAWRALETSLPQLKDGKDIKFLFLPDKEDPDSYIRKYGRVAFEGLLEKAQPLSVFFCNELSGRVNLGTSEGRARLVQRAGPLLAQINAPVFGFMLTKRISELTGVGQNQLAAFLKTGKKNRSSTLRPEASRPLSVTPYRRLIQILLHAPDYANKLDTNLLAVNDEQNEEKVLLVALVDFLKTSACSMEEELNSVTILLHFDQTPHRVLLEKIVRDAHVKDENWNIDAEFTGGMERLREMQRRSRMAELHSRPLVSLTPEEKNELRQLMLS